MSVKQASEHEDGWMSALSFTEILNFIYLHTSGSMLLIGVFLCNCFHENNIMILIYFLDAILDSDDAVPRMVGYFQVSLVVFLLQNQVQC